MALAHKRTYILLFRGETLGRIALLDADFPNLSGTFRVESATDHSEMRGRVANYVQFRVEADRLAQDSPHSLEEFLDLAEPGFFDLINSNEWSLVDDQGAQVPILPPVFSADNTVTWRWRDGAA